MKTLVTCLLGLCLVLPVSSDAWARRQHAHPKPHDEITLSPPMMRQLQSNLIEGGYLRGARDRRITHRTRRALREFQQEYHLPRTGNLDRATAEALLGHDLISSYVVAKR